MAHTAPTPTIHLNGSSAKVLKKALVAAYSAVSDAIDAVCQTAPHGRDYYPQGPEAFGAARVAHSERLMGLDKVLSGLHAQWQRIEDAEGGR